MWFSLPGTSEKGASTLFKYRNPKISGNFEKIKYYLVNEKKNIIYYEFDNRTWGPWDMELEDGMWNSKMGYEFEHGIWDMGYLDYEHGIWNMNSNMEIWNMNSNMEHGTWNMEYEFEHGIWDMGYGIWDFFILLV